MSLWTKRRDQGLRVGAYLPNWTNRGFPLTASALDRLRQVLERLGPAVSR